MKSYIKQIIGVFGMATMLSLVSSCGEKADFLKSVVPAGGARIKFYHAASDAPGVVIQVNGANYSGVNTVSPAAAAPLVYFSAYPAVDYGMLTAGTAKISINTAAAPVATVLAADLPVEDGKYYSVFAYGIKPNYRALVVPDVLVPADKSKAYVRLVNLVSTFATTPTRYDLLVNGVQIGTADFGATSGNFIPVDAIAFAGTAQTVQLRITGGTTIAALGTLQPYPGKFYTFIARGNLLNATTLPALSVSTNL